MMSHLDELRQRIGSYRQQAFDPRCRYFDVQDLKGLCTPQVIENAIKECPFPTIERNHIKTAILDNRILTFCILVHIGKEQYMTKFLDCDVDNMGDNRIPLDKESLKEIAREAADGFFEAQWEFRPVILTRNKYIEIKKERILPFDKDEPDEKHDGSFGRIFYVVINSPMQKLIETEEPYIKVVRKQLRSSDDIAAFARERDFLKVLQGLKHPNIVELLCSYTYGKEHNLVFRCEELNLDEFLAKEERHGDFVSNPVFYTALYGLSSAIEYIHGFDIGGGDENMTIIGYHRDIRPQNILVRRDTFVLTDFGLAKMTTYDSPPSSYRGGGGDYIAPECLEIGARSSCAADVWSFGGVIVDIVAYMEGGREDRMAAQKQRKADGPYQRMSSHFFFLNGEVKPAVAKTIESLQCSPKDKTTRTLLLLSKEMLKVKPGDRPDSNVVRENMAYIALKSLFRAALEAMIKWKIMSRIAGSGRIWEDAWKLWAWGEAVGINGARLVPGVFKGALRDGDRSVKKFINNLSNVLKLVPIQIREGKSEFRPSSRQDTDSHKPYSEDSEKINEWIRDLRFALPQKYRDKIEASKGVYGRFANEKPPTLPKLSDETFESTEPDNSISIGGTKPDPQKNGHQPKNSTSSQSIDLNITSKGLAIQYGIGNDDPVKCKETASINSDSVTSATMSYLANESPFNSLLTAQSAFTTPETQGSTFGASNKPLPPTPPSMALLPKPALDAGAPPPEQGQYTGANEQLAKIYFLPKDGHKREKTVQIHVERVSVPGKMLTRILSIGKESDIRWWHESCGHTLPYPHMQHPSGDRGKQRVVTFSGPQIMSEQLPSGATRFETQKICYTFADPIACDIFRQEVWGKELLIRAGVQNIVWSPLKEANTVTVTLWKEWADPALFSIVFRALRKGAKKGEFVLIELKLAQSRPFDKQYHNRLDLNIDPASAAAVQVVAGRKKAPEQLRMVFDDEQVCKDFKKKILEFAR